MHKKAEAISFAKASVIKKGEGGGKGKIKAKAQVEAFIEYRIPNIPFE